MNNDPYKTLKNIWFWDQKFKNKIEIATHMKIWSNFNHSKVPNY